LLTNENEEPNTEFH